MEQIKEKTAKPKRHWRLGFYIIGFIVCLLGIITLLRFGTVLFWLPVWSYLTNYLIDKTGLNVLLAKGSIALLVIPLIYVFALVFSWKKKQRKTGIVLLCAITALICFSLFFITKDVYFSPKTGEPVKWYLVMPDGEYKFSDKPEFDPLLGKKYLPVTPEVMEKYLAREKANKIRGKSETSQNDGAKSDANDQPAPTTSQYSSAGHLWEIDPALKPDNMTWISPTEFELELQPGEVCSTSVMRPVGGNWNIINPSGNKFAFKSYDVWREETKTYIPLNTTIKGLLVFRGGDIPIKLKVQLGV